MLENKKIEMQDDIKKLLIQYYPIKDKELIEYIVSNFYNYINGMVNKQDDKIISCCFETEKQLMLNKKLLLVGFLSGFAIHPDYKNGKYLDDVIKQTIDIQSKNYLISLASVYNPKELKKYGFEIIGYRKKYTISNKDIVYSDLKNIDLKYSIEELKNCYNEFAKCFGCYVKKDLSYFEEYEKAIKTKGGRIIVYRNCENEILGFCSYYKDNYIEVKDIIYLDSIALLKMLKYAVGNEQFVEVEVSSNEKLEKLFPNLIARKTKYIMGRINSLSLFNKLYNINASNTKEAFRKMNVIVNISEKV